MSRKTQKGRKMTNEPKTMWDEIKHVLIERLCKTQFGSAITTGDNFAEINSICESFQQLFSKRLDGVEQELKDKILYIGNLLPQSLLTDTRPKYVVLGTPEGFLKEINKLKE
ncbi:MAG: hypothetical protein QME51_10310 [Planctomycetota bacterium]|nr:hypothetical protein [Planctomycetota bacterium]